MLSPVLPAPRICMWRSVAGPPGGYRSICMAAAAARSHVRSFPSSTASEPAMSQQLSAIATALESIGAMLSADGYELEIRDQDSGVIVAEIKAGPEACAECLVPKG